MQPEPFSRGETAIEPNTTIDAAQDGGTVAILDGSNLRSLVAGLNSIGVKPDGIISILQGIKTAGALQAELVIAMTAPILSAQPQSLRRRLMTMAAGCTMLAMPGAFAQEVAAPATGIPANGDEIQQFCTNIADAARDQRYLLQKQDLEKLQGEVDARIVKLEERRAEYEDWLKRRNDFLKQAELGLVDIYKTMKADAAAGQLELVNPAIAAAIVMKLPPRQSSRHPQRDEQRQGCRSYQHHFQRQRFEQHRRNRHEISAFGSSCCQPGCPDCQNQTFNEIGRAPSMSPIGSGLQYAQTPQMAMYPKEPRHVANGFSIWSDNQAALFKDARALKVGDILTVDIRIDDKASFDNKTDRSRTNDSGFTIGANGQSCVIERCRLEGRPRLRFGSPSTKGEGTTERSEKLVLLVAAVVTGVLENGNLLISGSQEVRVNHEIRILNVAGIVRPYDVDAKNMISYDKIAEARISYGGRGRLTEVQQPPWGQQVMDIVSPI